MKISKIFKLKRTQFELDFVDIDPTRDKRLFVDPTLISKYEDPWSREVSDTIGSFFDVLINLLKAKKTTEALALFTNLNEPNETCLGMSQSDPAGRGVGKEDSLKIFQRLSSSKAIVSGLVKDIEDCVIFVEKFGPDKLSDMTTNIIRGHLVKYTQEQCKIWGIKLRPKTPTGKYWNSKTSSWDEDLEDMLVINGKVILLVPKSIVSHDGVYSADDYHRFDVLDFLKQRELSIKGPLVQYRSKKGKRKGEAYVTKKSLIEEGGAELSKSFLTDFTLKNQDIFTKYKKRKIKNAQSPQNHQITKISVNSVCDTLIKELKSLAPGPNNATQFHRLAMGILELIFYPRLVRPKAEEKIHAGRKRIDIVFNNAAESGFFHSAPSKFNIPVPLIAIECKNYSSDPQNPELDQLATRFAPQRGQLGLLICRDVQKPDLIIQRCADLWSDRHGLIIPLWDKDLLQVLEAIKEGDYSCADKLLYDRANAVATKS